MHACCGHFPLCSTFFQELHDFVPRFLCQIQGTIGWKLSHPTPVFALYNLDTFSNSHSFNLGSASSNFLSSSFSKVFSKSCMFSSHCQCFAHSFLCASQRSKSLASFFFLQDLRSSSPCCGVRDLVQKPRTAFRALDHVTHPLLMQCFHLSFLMFLFYMFSNQAYRFCMVSSTPGWSQAFSQSAANNSATHHRFSASIFPFGLIFFVFF